jgi:hypothetical protein
MEKLTNNWITEGWMDFEYKKYILLAYLKSVSTHFGKNRLYPPLADVIQHHRNLIKLKTEKELIANGFPKQINAIDPQRFAIHYERMIQDEDFMKELNDIIEFAIPMLEKQIQEGVDLYELVERHLSIEPVGIASLYQNEGFLIIDEDSDPFLRVFKYSFSIYENADERYRGLQTTFLQRIRKSIGRTLESVKVELSKQYRLFSNPSTYRVVSLLPFPFNETLMPVVKRSFVSFLVHDTNKF